MTNQPEPARTLQANVFIALVNILGPERVRYIASLEAENAQLRALAEELAEAMGDCLDEIGRTCDETERARGRCIHGQLMFRIGDECHIAKASATYARHEAAIKANATSLLTPPPDTQPERQRPPSAP